MGVAVRRLIYQDLLDTTKTPELQNDRSEVEARYLGLGNLMLSVLLGEVPVLSQTQAFDSSVLLNASAASDADSEAFLSLVRQGAIEVRLFNQPTVMDAFLSALNNEGFLFSAWPEVRSGLVGRTQVREALSAHSAPSLPGQLAARIDGLRALSAAIADSPSTARATKTEASLSGFLERTLKDAPLQEVVYLSRLDLRGERKDDRSLHYEEIAGWDAPETVKENTRDIVDMAYNTVMAASLRPNELALSSRRATTVETMRRVIGQPSSNRQPFSSDDVSGLHELGWSEIEEFSAKHSHVSAIDRYRETLAADFLAGVYRPSIGVALLPKVASTRMFATFAFAACMVGVLLPQTASCAAVTGGIASLITAFETGQRVRQLQIGTFRRRYRGLLAEHRVSTDPA